MEYSGFVNFAVISQTVVIDTDADSSRIGLSANADYVDPARTSGGVGHPSWNAWCDVRK